jgi:hypothetical protein
VSRGSAANSRSHASSVTSATGDPHATLSLFGPRSDPEPTSTPKRRPAPAPRASARPPTRDLTDILAGNDDDADSAPPSPTQKGRPASPRKNSNGGQQRAGANKNYHAIRVFDDPDEPEPEPEKAVKTNPNKYKHFEFGYGEGAAPTQPTPRGKHASQWDFADFVTPDKPQAKVRAHEVRHIAWSDDEVGRLSRFGTQLTAAGRAGVARAPAGCASGAPGREAPLRVHGQGRGRRDGEAAIVAAERLDGAVQGQRDQRGRRRSE